MLQEAQAQSVTIAVPLTPRNWALLQLLQNSSLAGDDATVAAAYATFDAPELVRCPRGDSD